MVAKASFVQLAHVFHNHRINGWYISEKLDGFRCLWDGGITRGMPISEVPFANKDRKDGRVVEPVATGCWSRYGNVIHAPDFLLDALPPIILDCEIFGGRGNFQRTRSIAAKFPENRCDSDWKELSFVILDSPTIDQVFKPRVIDEVNFKCDFAGVLEWVRQRLQHLARSGENPYRSWAGGRKFIEDLGLSPWVITLHPQERLPIAQDAAVALAYQKLKEVNDAGGEGVMIRNSVISWMPERVHSCLKLKPELDSEGVVVGYRSGLGKYLGMVGAFRVRAVFGDGEVEFDLSGFTDQERKLTGEGRQFAIKYPGRTIPTDIVDSQFPLGTVVTFKYRELSDAGIPKEAKYYRRSE